MTVLDRKKKKMEDGLCWWQLDIQVNNENGGNRMASQVVPLVNWFVKIGCDGLHFGPNSSFLCLSMPFAMCHDNALPHWVYIYPLTMSLIM